MELQVGRKFRLGRRITSSRQTGTALYSATNIETGEDVAIKLERRSSRLHVANTELAIYKALAGGKGITKFHCYIVDGKHNLMVCDGLAATLAELFAYCKQQFSLKTVIMIAMQMIDCIEWIHSNDFIHCNLTPENFAIGIGEKSSTIHIVNFDCATKCQTCQNLGQVQRIPSTDGFKGTPYFASINAHRGIVQSRRDDLEQIGYIMIYFLRGSLPWEDSFSKSPNSTCAIMKRSQEELWRSIMEKKLQIPVEALCKGFPAELSTYLNYCRNLNFEDQPDYNYLRQLMQDIMCHRDWQHDFIFDWTLLNYRFQRPDVPRSVFGRVDPVMAERRRSADLERRLEESGRSLDVLKRRAEEAERKLAESEKQQKLTGEEISAHATCPISQLVMEEPVVCSDGISYERECIEQWLSTGRQTSPKTNMPLPDSHFVPNVSLRNMIEALRKTVLLGN